MYSNLYIQKQKSKYKELANLITNDLIDLLKEKKHIIIYGHTKSGKNIIGKLISKKLNCDLIKSDDFIKFGFKNSMYIIRELLLNKYKDKQVIFEGVQASRLLRKGIQKKDYNPDILLHIICNKETIKHCYFLDNEIYKLKGGKVWRFNDFLDKIFYEWYDNNDKKPIIIKIDTSFK